MRLCSIASGSSGNCIYVGSEATHLLVDVGISGKKAEAGLNSLGLTGRDLDGILVTHEHMDHVAGLGVMARKYEVPIYATTGTLEEIQKMGNLGKINPALFREVKEDVKLTIKDLTVNPMKISHDAAQPVGYRIAYGDKKVGICTDLGVYNDYTVECLKGMDALLLEANHDVNMLQVGRYPYYLKRRILGREGHLSNERCAELIEEVATQKTKKVYLGHLSKENNYEKLAYETVKISLHNFTLPIEVARRDTVSTVTSVS